MSNKQFTVTLSERNYNFLKEMYQKADPNLVLASQVDEKIQNWLQAILQNTALQYVKEKALEELEKDFLDPV